MHNFRLFSSRTAIPVATTVLLGVFLVWGCGDVGTDGTSDGTVASGSYEGDEGLVLKLKFDPDPPAVGEVDLTMEVTVDDAPLEGADLELEPWMPAHGHGSNTVPSITHLNDGLYGVDDLTFSMAGHWELEVDVEWDDHSAVIVIDLEVEG